MDSFRTWTSLLTPFLIHKWHQKYGPVVRVAPNELSFNSATSWDDIYGIRPGHRPFLKSDLYGGGSFHEVATSIVTERDSEVHRLMRKQLLPAFSEQAVHAQEPLIKEIVDELILQVSKESKKGPVDLTRWLDMALFDLTGSLAFGKSYNALKNGGTHSSVAFILKALKQLAVVDALRRMPALAIAAKLIFWKMVEDLNSGNKRHEKNCLDMIISRRENPSNRPDFLTFIKKDEKGAQLSDVQLAAHAADLLQAGAHSVNTTLCAAIYFSLRNKSGLKKLQIEIRDRFSAADQITSRSVQGLSFARAVCLEAMRLYPPVPFGLPRVVPEGGDTVDGHLLPPGIVVSTNPLAASHASAHFSNPLEFIPQRWLQKNTVDQLRASQPFSLGIRGCMGQNLGWAEMLGILAKLVYTYDFELLDEELDWLPDSTMNVMWERPHLFVKLTEVDHATKEQ